MRNPNQINNVPRRETDAQGKDGAWTARRDIPSDARRMRLLRVG